MQPDVASDIESLSDTLTTIEKVLDLNALSERARELELKAADPLLWDDPTNAQKVTSDLSHTQSTLKKVRALRQRVEDLPVMYELAEEENEGTELADDERADLRQAIESMEVQTMLSGEYDERDAVVTIRSGAGGVDAADWAEMLMRMYIRWAEKEGHKVQVFDTSYAEEAGIKSATFQVSDPYVRHAVGGAGHAPSRPYQPL